MSDQTNANLGDDKSSKNAGSPWDDELDLPEEKPQNKPAVIGSFEDEEPKVEAPVPFNVPEDVIEDKVGKMVPATEVMGKDVPQFYIPEGDLDGSTRSVSKDNKIDSSLIQNEVTQEKSVAEKNASLLVKSNGSQTQIDKKPQINNQINNPEVSILEKKPSQPSNQTPNLSAKAVPTPSPKLVVDNQQSKKQKNDETVGESGVMELVSKKETRDPFADPFSATAPTALSGNKENPVDINPDQNSQISKNSTDIATTPKVSGVPNKSFDALTSPSINDSDVDEVEKEEVRGDEVMPKIAQEIDSPPQKISFLQKIRGSVDKAQKKSDSKLASPNNRPADKPGNRKLPEEPYDEIFPHKKSSIFSTKVSVVFAVILLLFTITYLTEIGLVSLGAEKIYGAVGLEKLWGGLPRNVEQAVGMAAIRQKENLDFKYKGTMSITVDKTKQSPVTTPLVAYAGNDVLRRDSVVAMYQNAFFSQYDYYDDDYNSDYYNDSEETESEDIEYPTAEYDESVDDSSSSSEIETPDPSDSDIAESDDISGGNYDDNYLPVEPTIKQLDFELEGKSSPDSISSSILLKQLIGSDKKIDFLNSNGSIFVQSSDIIFDQRAESGKWLQYSFDGLEDGNNLSSIFDIDINSGFSVTGRRVANEKVAGVRAYRYTINNMELGDSLGALGIKKEDISEISGEVWIGVKDRLIRKLNLVIVPSISSSITRLAFEIEIFDYQISNNNTIPALTNVIKIDSTKVNAEAISNSENSDNATSNIVQNTSEAQSSTAQESVAGRIENDEKRHNDLVAVKSALSDYKERYGQYPKSTTFININSSNNFIKKLLVPGYIGEIPSDPKLDEGWWYGYKSDGKNFTLSARFENINDREVTKVGGVYLHFVRN